MRRPSFLQSMGRTNHYNDYVRRINRHFTNYLNFILKKKKENLVSVIMNQFPENSKSRSLVFTLWVNKESAVHQTTCILTPPTISVSACI